MHTTPFSFSFIYSNDQKKYRETDNFEALFKSDFQGLWSLTRNSKSKRQCNNIKPYEPTLV